MTTSSRDTYIFRDLDLDFLSHPISQDVTTEVNESAIKQSIKTLILTNHYERPFHSELGSSVRDQLFENMNPLTQHMMKRSIEDVINNYEPRVVINDIVVDMLYDDNAVKIIIDFTIRNTSKKSSVDFILEQTR